MRIALVVRRLAGLRGGAERVVCELAGSLASRGHAVTVVTYEAAQGDPAFGIGDARVIDLFPAVLRSASGRGAGSDAIEAAGSAVEVDVSFESSSPPVMHRRVRLAADLDEDERRQLSAVVDSTPVTILLRDALVIVTRLDVRPAE